MISFNGPLETLIVKFREFLIIFPKVSRVSQFSTENLDLGFIHLIEGAFHLSSVLLTFKAYC